MHYRLSSIAECDPNDPYRLNDGWSVLHGHFHVALAAARAVKHLLRMRAQLFEQCERYRRLFVPLRYVNRDVELEHLKIKDAVLTVDCANMSTLMHEHHATTTQIIIYLSISNYGDGKICLER